MKLKEIASYIDNILDVFKIPDVSKNSLQVADTISNKDIKKIGFSVDATNDAIQKAIDEKCDILIVHHGIFWGDGITSIKEFNYKKIALLIENKIALYAAHLPLDKHEFLGNNIVLAKKLQLKNIKPFGYEKEMAIGFYGEIESLQKNSIQDYIKKNTNLNAECILFGKEEINTVAIITGKANTSLLEQVYYKKIDLFVTGEHNYPAYNTAKDLNLNIAFLGHYNSETYGLKELQKHIDKELQIETVFLDTPTTY